MIPMGEITIRQRHAYRQDRSRQIRYCAGLRGLKENDKAFEWLEKALQVRYKGLTNLKVDPCLDSLRTEPRFNALMQRVGFPIT